MSSISGVGHSFSPQMISGASGYSTLSSKLASAFQTIDTTHSGTITQSQLEQAFSSLKAPPKFKALGADAVFSKLDTNGTGSISQQQFVDGIQSIIQSQRSAGQQAQLASGSNSSTPTQSLNQSLLAFLQIGVSTNSTSQGIDVTV